MRFDVAEISRKGISKIRISYEDQSIDVEVPSYASAAIIRREEMFDELNTFLSTFSKADRKTLWELFLKSTELLSEEFRSSYMVRDGLEEVVKGIYEIVTYQRLKSWVDHAGLVIPPDVSDKFEEFTPEGNRNYRSRTYIREDYIDMVALALGLRLMIPIWGTYVNTVAVHGGNGFKESEVVKLIEQAGLQFWPPYRRMLEYIDASIDKEVSMTMVMATLSSAETPRHLMAMALVRKISIGPISSAVAQESLARILFNYVTGTHQRMDDRFKPMIGTVHAKRSRLDRNDEDNSSVLDGYQQATEITEGDRQLIEVYSENIANIVKRIAPDLSIRRVRQCIREVSRVDGRDIEPFQKAIVFWVIRVISPEARELLMKLTMFRLMGITQAILDHWGYHELAILVAAEEFIDDSGEVYMSSDVRSKLSKQQIEILDKQYPYYRQTTRRAEPGKRNNEAIIAIDMVTEWMSGRAWMPHAPEDIIAKIPLLAETGNMYVPGDIKRQLADVIIKINQEIQQHATN